MGDIDRRILDLIDTAIDKRDRILGGTVTRRVSMADTVATADAIWNEIEDLAARRRAIAQAEEDALYRPTPTNSYVQTFNDEIDKELAEWDKILHPKK